jgi:hypothetical protein
MAIEFLIVFTESKRASKGPVCFLPKRMTPGGSYPLTVRTGHLAPAMT